MKKPIALIIVVTIAISTAMYYKENYHELNDEHNTSIIESVPELPFSTLQIFERQIRGHDSRLSRSQQRDIQFNIRYDDAIVLYGEDWEGDVHKGIDRNQINSNSYPLWIKLNSANSTIRNNRRYWRFNGEIENIQREGENVRIEIEEMPGYYTKCEVIENNPELVRDFPYNHPLHIRLICEELSPEDTIWRVTFDYLRHPFINYRDGEPFFTMTERYIVYYFGFKLN